jgi:hypothetical protein
VRTTKFGMSLTTSSSRTNGNGKILQSTLRVATECLNGITTTCEQCVAHQ